MAGILPVGGGSVPRRVVAQALGALMKARCASN
jgi:hypothetical protein